MVQFYSSRVGPAAGPTPQIVWRSLIEVRFSRQTRLILRFSCSFFRRPFRFFRPILPIFADTSYKSARAFGMLLRAGIGALVGSGTLAPRRFKRKGALSILTTFCLRFAWLSRMAPGLAGLSL